jgi:hypothetical protein
MFLMAVICLISTVFWPGATPNWLASVEDTWLLIIFKLHAGFDAVNIDQLSGLNILDLAILALAGVMHLGLYAELRGTSRVWSIAAVIQPFLGIALFLATEDAGRSAVMGSALVASLVMLRSPVFRGITAQLGILGSILLLVGDFSAGVTPASTLMASLFAAGYTLLTMWFFQVARRLSRLGRAW